MPITEQDAIEAQTLAEQFPDRLDVLEASAKLLQSYKAQQQEASQPLFPEMRRREVEDYAKVRNYFTQPETHGLDDETRQGLFADLPDEESRAAMFSEELLARYYRRPAKEIRALGTQYRDQYAIEKWGAPVKTYKEFFDKQKNAYLIEDQVDERAQDAGMRGLPRVMGWADPKAFGKDPDAALDQKAMENQKELQKRFEETHAATTTRMAQHRQFVMETVEDLKTTMGVEGAQGEAVSYREFAERLTKIPPQDLNFVISAIRANAGGTEEGKAVVQKIVENLGRGIDDIVGGIDTMGDRIQAVDLRKQIEQGVEVPAGKESDPETYLQAVRMKVFAGDDYELRAGVLKIVAGKEFAKPSEETKAQALALADTLLDTIDLHAKVKSIAENDVDPARGEHMYSRGLYALVRSLPYTAVAMARGGTVLNGLAMQEQAYQALGRVNPDMSREQKIAFSAVAAPLMALTEKIPVKILSGRLPTLGRLMNQATATSGAFLARGSIRVGGGIVANVVQENVQDLMPFAVQSAVSALSQDVSEVPWEKVYGGEFWEQQGEIFFATLPLVLVGTGVGTIRDFQSARETLHNRDAITLLVGDYAKADEIRKAADAGDYDTAQTLLRKGMKEAKTDSVPFVQARAAAGKVLKAHAQAQADAIKKAEQAGYIPEVVPREGGFVVKGKDFESPVFKTREEANTKRWEHVEEQGLELHEDMVSAIDFLSRSYQPDRAIDIENTGKRRLHLDAVREGQRTREQAMGRSVAAAQIDDQGNPQEAPQAQEQESDLDIEAEYQESFSEAERKSLDEDDKLAHEIIIGESSTAFRDGVYRTGVKLNQGATWATFVEEKTEGDAATFILKGKRDWLANKLFAYDAEFQKGRLVGGRKLSIFKDGVTMETATDEDLKEAYSRAALYYLTGSMRKGKVAGFKPSAGFRNRYAEAVRAGMSAIFDPYARFFRAVAVRAARLNKMRREGRLDAELERELARSVGITEQFEYEQEVTQEAAKIREEMEDAGFETEPEGVIMEPSDDSSFSVIGGFGERREGMSLPDAVAWLVEEQSGIAVGALSFQGRPISLVWGGAGERKGEGFGLAKILVWHPEVDPLKLQEMLDRMKVSKETNNTLSLEGGGFQAVIRRNIFGEAQEWLLTAYGKDVPAQERIDGLGAKSQGRQTLPEKDADRSSQKTDKESSFSVIAAHGGRSVVVGARPGEYGWTPGGIAATEKEKQNLESELVSLAADPEANAERIRKIEDELRGIASKTLPGPVTHPTQKRPRLERVGEAAGKIIKSGKAKKLLSDLYGVTGLNVKPVTGTWLGNREPSFVIQSETLTDEQAAEVGALLGFAWAQDATVVSRPNPSLTEGIPAYYLGSKKRLSEEQVNAIHEAARERGLDFSTTSDGKSVQFLFFGEETDLPAFTQSIADIKQASGLTESHQELVSSDLNETQTDFSPSDGGGRTKAWLHGTAEGLALFERVVSDLVAPYAKAIGAEGYRFNVDLYAKRFGLSVAQTEIVKNALYPSNGKLKSSVPIMDGSIDLGVEGVTKKNGRFVSSVTNVVWSLQNWSAQFGLIAPGDYSKQAGKLIAQTIADEVAWHVQKAMESGKRSAIGWYDRALKAAKQIYARMFSELDVNGPGYNADMAMVFDAMLGIASQGNNVTDNSVMTTRVYANWRRDKIDPAGNINVNQGMTITQAVAPVTGTFGSKTVAIENNYLKLETLLANNSYAELRKFFNKTDTVRNINAYLRKNKNLWFNGEPLSVDGAADQKVTGWMVFGPKIGSFINNLHGDYTTLTADLWFSRTWNRILGWSFIHSPEREAQNFISLRDAMVAEYTNDQSVRKMEKGKPVYWDHGTDVAKLGLTPAEFDDFINDPQKMLDFASRIEVIFRTGAREGAKKTTSYKDKSAVRRAAKTWVENREDVMEAPRSDHERMFQQDVMEKAQKMLKTMGIDISIADMQAALWYNEKDLYATLGSTTKLSAPADYEDAAKTTFRRIQEGTLYERIGAKEGEVDERIQPREWEAAIFAGINLKSEGGDNTFSVISNAESRIADSFNPYFRSPKRRREILLEAQRRGRETARDFQKMISLGKNVGRLDREQATREGVIYGDLLVQYFGADTDAKVAALPAVDTKAARSEAKRQAAEWRKAQDRQQQKIPRDTLISAMRTLDAMISALPIELRGRVGGMVKLAQFTTPEAMLGELERRAEKMDDVLETYLKKEANKEVEKLFEIAKPAKDESGKKRVGKAGADIHDLFDMARKAWKTMSAVDAEAHAVGLESKVAAGNLTPEEEAHALLEAELVRAFGGWNDVYQDSGKVDKNGKRIMVKTLDGADAVRKNHALDTATYIWKAGYLAYQQKKAAEKARRDVIRQDLEQNTGKTGLKSERALAEEAGVTLPGKAKDFFLSLLNFEQLTQWIFGKDSQWAQWFADQQRKAENTKLDAVQAVVEGVEDLFTSLAGGDRFKGEQLQFRMMQRSITATAANGDVVPLSELEALSALLMWQQEDGKRHLRGKRDQNGKLTSRWSYDQAFIDEISGKLSPEAWRVLGYLQAEYGKEYEPLNAVYREVYGINLPKNPNYSPLLVKPQQATPGQMQNPVTGTTATSGSFTPPGLRTRAIGVSAEPDFRDAVATFIGHKKQMEHWMANAKFVLEANAVLGNRDLGNAIEAAHGEQAVMILRKWLDAIAQGGVRDASAGTWAMKLFERITGRAASMALVGRIGTLAIQATQLGAASALMPTGAYVVRLGKLLSGNLGWSEALASPYIQRRLKQQPVMVQAAMEGLRAGTPTQLKHQVRKLGSLLNGTDALFTAGTYAMVYDYHLMQALKGGMSDADAKVYAAGTAERVVESVAQPTRMGTRSWFEISTTNPGWKLSWAFASDARKNVALLGNAYAKGNATDKLRTTLFVIGINGLMSGIIRSAWRDLRDDEDEEIFDDKYWSVKRLALSTSTDWIFGFPVIGEEIQRALYAAAGEYNPDGGLLSAVKDAIGPIKRTRENFGALLEGDWEQPLRDTERVMTAMGLFSDSAAAATSVMHLVRDLYGLGTNFIPD